MNARVFLSPLRDTRVHEIIFGEIDDATGLATVCIGTTCITRY